MGIDSGTVLEEQHEQGRQRPLSEASRRQWAQEEPGAGEPLSTSKTAVRDYPATKLVFNFGSLGITFTHSRQARFIILGIVLSPPLPNIQTDTEEGKAQESGIRI